MAGRDPDPLICIGAIAGAHGVRGGVRIKPFTDDPEAVAAYGAVSDESGDRRYELRLTGRAKGVVLAKLSGIETREAAEALKGLRLYVPRAALPPPDADEFYHADLVGLAVETMDGDVFGNVHAVHDFGAGDLLEIRTAEGELVLLPFTEAAVPVVDIAAGRVVIDPPPGLLDAPEDTGDTEEPAKFGPSAATKSPD
jgi:16S rRNA processing protein RimM